MLSSDRNLVRALQSFSQEHWFARYASFDSARFSKLWHEAGEIFWNGVAEKRALALFHAVAERVPAYGDFLKKNHIKPATIRTIKDFSGLPETNKENYVLHYPIADRMWDGAMDAATIVAISSGTSGEPQFWPRGEYQEFEAAIVHELLYKSLYKIDQKKTLLLIGFPVGMYVSGVATLLPSWLTAIRGYPLTVVSVGNNKKELLRTLVTLGKEYEQVIIAGHPFFIKDVLETARLQKLRVPADVKTFMCSEGFSEPWRKYLAALAGTKQKTDMLSTYGSSELLLMGYETPLTIAVRNSSAFEKTFTRRLITPNLFQYNPFIRYIESSNGELVFTAQTGAPSIRFNLHDSGEVISHATMQKTMGFKSGKNDWKLPFVTLHGRSDRTLVFYAANIYPEHIKAGLEHPSLFKMLTGKFVMQKEYTKNMDQVLEINVELQPGGRSSKKLAKTVQRHVLAALHRLSMEFKDTVAHHQGKDLVPKIKLHPYQSAGYFPVGIKPHYIA